MDEHKDGNRNDRPDYNRNDGGNRNFGGGGGMNRNRGGGGGGNRFRGGHNRGGGPMHHGRGRIQRPLLTSSINGAGLSLVALVLVKKSENPQLHQALSLAVVAFALSAFVSYFAQRLRHPIPEWISDGLF